VRIGSHLPQYGRVAGPEAMTRAARHAEALGFADLWVSDHIVHPAAQSYPSPYLFDPLLTLTWAAAVTERIGLGTSVLVAPQHNPLTLANTLASLDALSAGRLTVALGVGWSEAEFDALGYSFHDRGARTDEMIALLRTCWRDDPVSFHGRFSAFTDIRVLPGPAHEIPIWVGGSSERGLRRGVTLGDGFQLIGVSPEEARAPIARLRRDRPDEAFVISLRTGWDPLGMEPGQIAREYDGYREAGVQHVVCAPWRTTIDDWLRSLDRLAAITSR
jgi:probable F420-dependent oxidoreductase